MPNRLAWPLVIGTALLAACGTSAPSPTAPLDTPATPTIVPYVTGAAITATPLPTAGAPTATPGPAWLGSGCDANEIVAALRPTIPYAQSSLSHNYLMSVYYLNVWVVDPGLDPLAGEAQLDLSVALARRHAALLSAQLSRADVCLGSVFDQIVVTVVDRDYNSWFSGSIDPQDLPESDAPSDAELDTVIEAFSPGFVRSAVTASVGRSAASAEACTWEQASARMQERLGADHPNSAFYYAIDDSGANVWAQWDGPADIDVFLPEMMEMGIELACLHPAADTFWVVYTDAYGGAQLIVAEPGEAIRLGDRQAMLDQLQVVYPQSSQ